MPYRIELADGFMILPDTVGFYVIKGGITIMFQNELYEGINVNNIHPIGIEAKITLDEVKLSEKVVNA